MTHVTDVHEVPVVDEIPVVENHEEDPHVITLQQGK